MVYNFNVLAKVKFSCIEPLSLDNVRVMTNIIEIQSIREVLPFLDDRTHLFFDLDNTILTSVSEFGGERWEKFMVEHFVETGMNRKEASNRATHLWKAVQTVSEIQFVEEETHAILKGLKHTCFAITARDFAFRSVTEKQLDHLNVQFSSCNAPFTLNEPDYARGVFYCGDIPKGKVLKWYADHHPGCRIVLVDDLRIHLETAAEHLDSFIGLRYGFLDERKAKYNPCEITKLLGKIITHPQANHFLKRTCDFGI